MKHVFCVLFIFILAVIQTTVLSYVEMFHVLPNLLFILVVCYSLRAGDYSGLFIALLCGLLLDITGDRQIGINTFLCVLVAYFCISISGSLFNNNAIVSMVFVLLLSLPYEFLTYLFHFVIWGNGSFWYAIFLKILPISIYNFIFTFLLYPIIKRFAGTNA